MKVFCFLLLLSVSAKLSAQQADTKALLQQLSRSKKDTVAVQLLIRLGAQYWNSIPDSLFYYSNEAMHLAEKIGDKEGEIMAKDALGGYWWAVGDYGTAGKLFLEIRDYYQSIGDSLKLGVTYSSILNIYRDQGDYKEALYYAFLEMNSFPDSSFPSGMVNAMTGSVYYEMGNMDSAYYFLTKSLNYPLNIGPGWIFMMNGRVNVKRDSLVRGLNFYRRAIVELRKENNLKDLAQTYNSIGELYLKTGTTDSAIYYGRLAIDIGERRKFRKEMIQSYQLLSTAYEKKDPVASFDYFRRSAVAKDSLYNQDKQRELLSYKFNEQLRQTELENFRKQAETMNSIYLLGFVLAAVILLAVVLIRNNRRKQSVNRLLSSQKATLESTLEELKATQAQLIQAEKMAGLGEVTAGIAHEIQNPLNFVNNFSELNAELIADLRKAVAEGTYGEVDAIAGDIAANEFKILHHGQRAGAIVAGMLAYSRQTAGEKRLVDINAICEESLQQAYQACKIKNPDLWVDLSAAYDQKTGEAKINAAEFNRALANLFDNAFYEVIRKYRAVKSVGGKYRPSVRVTTAASDGEIEIAISDNGDGIPAGIRDKIFQPFFTTRPAGDGTGLGLSLVYDIVTKSLGGSVNVSSKGNSGTTFLLRFRGSA